MGKGEELWDDSALVTAFDSAISKYKVMHGINGSSTHGKIINSTVHEEHVQSHDYIGAALDTEGEVVETADSFQVLENPTLESGFPEKDVDLSHTQNDAPPPISQAAVTSDVKSQDQRYSDGWEEYNQLYNRYYEIEDQRQKILQQLNQYSNWNYQNPVSTTSKHQESVAPPYVAAACCCAYGCQNWVVPCNSVPASCSGGACTDKDCTVISKDVQDGNSMSEKDPDIVKTAMATAEMALTSLTKGASSNASISTNGVKDKAFGMERGHLTESANSATDLSAVLNAWYSAGFYTGKYLSEQSLDKRKHG